MVVEGDDSLGPQREIGRDGPNAGTKCLSMPHGLCHDALGLRRGLCPIAEACVEPPHVVRRPSDGAGQQMPDHTLQDVVSRQPESQRLCLRLRGTRTSPARRKRRRPGNKTAASCHDSAPLYGSVRSSSQPRCARYRAAGRGFEIAELIEHEQRILGGRRPRTLSIHCPDKSLSAASLGGRVSSRSRSGPSRRLMPPRSAVPSRRRAVPVVLPRACIRKHFATLRVVHLAIRQQTGIVSDRSGTEFQLQACVQVEPRSPIRYFIRRVRHRPSLNVR
jgi:hypothetical protein